MGQVIQTNGDYNIRARSDSGATIRLDAGSNGTVRVVGNFLIEGTSTEVSVDQLKVKDNIIILNDGETGAGVSLTYSGIKVDRGTLPNTSIIWDETISSWALYSGSESSFDINDSSRLTLKELRTDPTEDTGKLFFNVGPTGVIQILGSNDYRLRVTDENHIPNKAYVDDAIQNQPTFQLRSDDTRVYIVDKDTPNSESIYITQTGNPALPVDENAAAIVIIEGDISTEFFQNRVTVRGLEFSENKITTNETFPGINENVFIETRGTGRLQTNVAVQFDHRNSPPAAVLGGATLIYGATPSVGTSGIWYVNSNTGENILTANGELISKDKALVFSMLF
jgi:archaellum component FlaG (FlaF/FlaG flagellin family)